MIPNIILAVAFLGLAIAGVRYVVELITDHMAARAMAQELINEYIKSTNKTEMLYRIVYSLNSPSAKFPNAWRLTKKKFYKQLKKLD